LIGIELNEKRQLELLTIFTNSFKHEYERFPENRTHVPHEYYMSNGFFGPVDGEMLYCMIRHFRPKKIFEIGSGNSTFLSAQAVLRNGADGRGECRLVAFEPYPNPTLLKGFPGLHELHTIKAQEIPIEVFEQLEEKDFLFIDSSHVLKTGSDVQYEYLEILPRLAKGVIVHVHDVFLPEEYPKEWVLDDLRFWNEQYLLQAFLTFNNRFEILWAGNYMHLTHPGELGAAFPSYDSSKTRPGSFWMRRI
jgi:predicted O-methyltransferase YrrM